MKNHIYRAERSQRRSRSAPLEKLTIATILAVLLLGACSSAATPTVIPTVMLDGGSTTNNSSESSAGDSVTASAVIVPVKDVQLSFSAIGLVSAVNAKVGDNVTAGQTLVTLDTTVLEARVKEAEANLLTAQVDRKYKERLKLDQIHLQVSDAEIARMQALLDSANAMMETQSALIAPFNGTIISVDVAAGETVVPGTAVIVLGDLSSYKIETTDLSERDVTRIDVGQPATVFIEALGKDFPAKVTDIARSSTTLGGDVVFKVTLQLDNQPHGLLWGMSADVSIETAR